MTHPAGLLVDVNTPGPEPGTLTNTLEGKTMYTITEIEAQHVELLPAKETLLLNTNFAAIWASNSSLALNAATVLSAANSAAVQTIVVGQG